jgi:phosphoesterase RecJ-like protein
MTELSQIAAKIAGAERILLTCHRGPDGDSIGSMVALASLLRERGKHATLYNPDLVPRVLKWLPHTRTLVHKLRADARYDITVVVDTGDPKLLGKSFPKPEVTGEVIVLDHHASGIPFGDFYYCDSTASAIGILVARIARILEWSLNEDAAAGIFVALVSDTGSFRYSNTTAEAFELAAMLVRDYDLDPWYVHERLSSRVPLRRYKLLSAALATIELACDGNIAFMTITKEMVKEAGATWEDTGGTVDYTRAIDGVDCGVLITPAKRGGVRVSLRSKAHKIDAGAVCKELGGGGHPGAAGCTLKGSLEDARKTVEDVLAAALKAADEAMAADAASV